jgi:hypothetical protein
VGFCVGTILCRPLNSLPTIVCAEHSLDLAARVKKEGRSTPPVVMRPTNSLPTILLCQESRLVARLDTCRLAAIDFLFHPIDALRKG